MNQKKIGKFLKELRKEKEITQEEFADKLSDYATAEKETLIRNLRNYSIMGTTALVVYSVLELTKLTLQNMLLAKIAGYCETLALVTVIMIMAHTTGLTHNIQKRKNRDISKKLPKWIQIIITAIVAFVGAAIIKLLLIYILGL